MNKRPTPEQDKTETAEQRLKIEQRKFKHYGMPPNPEGDKATAAYWAALFPRPEWLKTNG